VLNVKQFKEQITADLATWKRLAKQFDVKLD
jgi:hypothetical protein